MFVYVALTRRGRVVGTVAAAIADGQGHLRGMAVHPDFQHGELLQSCWSVRSPIWALVIAGE